jgi:dolichol-phosphate mannosyltransferase
MLKKAEELDIVIGSRLVEGGRIIGRSPIRDLLSIFTNLAIRATTGLKICDWTSGLRIYRRSTWEAIMPHVNCNKWDFQFESLYKATLSGFRIGEVPITFHERADGDSKFSVIEALDFIGSFLKVRFWEN